MMDKIEMLYLKAVDLETLRSDPNDGRYTVPNTWGVYEIEATKCGPAGKRFRKGNHPVRLQELQREFGEVKVGAVFSEEQLASELTELLNFSFH